MVEELTDPGTQPALGGSTLSSVCLPRRSSKTGQASARSVCRTAGARSCSTTSANSARSSQTSRRFTYHSEAGGEVCDAFAGFLQHRAEDAYPEGWHDNQYANPDALRIMTIHQAKGMQWPVVFVPALLREPLSGEESRGPDVASGISSRADGVKGQPRFEGTIEDERRLFYVAMTRSQQVPAPMTWAPVPGNQPLRRGRSAILGRHPSLEVRQAEPRPTSQRASVSHRCRVQAWRMLSFSFSDLKYFFECPYQFKLRVLYGFNAPIHEALGYGKSLHDALAEVHARAI